MSPNKASADGVVVFMCPTCKAKSQYPEGTPRSAQICQDCVRGPDLEQQVTEATDDTPPNIIF